MADALYQERHEFDVCVVGGGMAGLCAAIAAARNGAKTCLVHDRPVLGGNASSEVRMWICGAHGKHNKETGLLEEIQLENQYRNPSGNYSLWDSVLWGKAALQPGLTLILNASVCDGAASGGRLESVRAWQTTSQTWHTIHAKLFIDCSGDSILAPLSGATTRWGRESREEFGEGIQPSDADRKTMGNSLLIQLRRTDEPQPFTPPRWAYRFERPEDLPHRMNGVNGANFWWIEVGGLDDTIGDAERIRDELMRITYGVWDYIKNRAPQREKAENWAVEWIGSLPGKRESRRYEGDHILTQHDVRRGEGNFDDVVAYGGWSMDDHHPAGIYYPGKPTIFHPAPSPYGIPYRCLYSRDVSNLLCAGRNISVTHAALSSTRVMGTTAILGQAAGTAAALCVKHGCLPRALSSGERLRELQRTLMDDDCWLPGVARPADELARAGRLATEGDGAAAEVLRDGTDRDREGASHAWEGAVGAAVSYAWDAPVTVGGVRLTLDSNLAHEKRMPCSYPQKGGRTAVPGSLLRTFRIEAQGEDGAWRTVHRGEENYQRLVRVPLNVRARAVRLVPEATWGDAAARVFAFEPVADLDVKIPRVPEGARWSEVVARVPAEDLAPPEGEADAEAKAVAHSA